jgi:tetratricopeptide (TPR) repeat protein
VSWDWAGAEEEFRRAIQRNPDYAQAHHFYGFLLAAEARPDEAFAQFRQALEIDPLSLIINADYGWSYYCARRYDDAIEQLQKTIEMDARFPQTYLWLGLTFQAKGLYEQSIAAFDEGIRLTAGNLTFVAGKGATLVLAGRREEAERILGDFEERRKTQYVPMAAMTQMSIALGKFDRAFEWLDTAAEYRASFMLPIRVYPFFDPIRSDPRFAALLARNGFVEPVRAAASASRSKEIVR